jgi:hypothetical protein
LPRRKTMRRLIAILALGTVLLGLVPTPAGADAATDAALALGAFAVFSQLWGPAYWGYGYGWPYGYGRPYPYYAYPYYPPPVVYTVPPSQPAVPLVQREVVFPHGRYVLRGDGMTEPYQWLWVPNPPATPVPPPPTHQ